ncbi:MAG: hypothetical protein H7A32_06130 [Deltaproteobacteria bacterium]|nr:hypothetical protein [Deltaproteobacteria bacterium]
MSSILTISTCCAQMGKLLEDPRVKIKYNAKYREYSIPGSEDEVVRQLLDFCPWCGKKLPQSLRENWFDELEKLGITDPNNQPNEIPPEFKTDEWWKQRGL